MNLDSIPQSFSIGLVVGPTGSGKTRILREISELVAKRKRDAEKKLNTKGNSSIPNSPVGSGGNNNSLVGSGKSKLTELEGLKLTDGNHNNADPSSADPISVSAIDNSNADPGLTHRQRTASLDSVGNFEDSEFPPDKAVCSIVDQSRLACVGLNKIPTWLRPMHVLSTGERSRVLLAKNLTNGSVIDDFASVVDGVTAFSVSNAMGKMIRKEGLGGVLVGTTKGEVIPWLQPDFVVLAETREVVLTETKDDKKKGLDESGDDQKLNAKNESGEKLNPTKNDNAGNNGSNPDSTNPDPTHPDSANSLNKPDSTTKPDSANKPDSTSGPSTGLNPWLRPKIEFKTPGLRKLARIKSSAFEGEHWTGEEDECKDLSQSNVDTCFSPTHSPAHGPSHGPTHNSSDWNRFQLNSADNNNSSAGINPSMTNSATAAIANTNSNSISSTNKSPTAKSPTTKSPKAAAEYRDESSKYLELKTLSISVEEDEFTDKASNAYEIEWDGECEQQIHVPKAKLVTEINKGTFDIGCIVGPSGSGKTRAARCLAGSDADGADSNDNGGAGESDVVIEHEVFTDGNNKQNKEDETDIAKASGDTGRLSSNAPVTVLDVITRDCGGIGKLKGELIGQGDSTDTGVIKSNSKSSAKGKPSKGDAKKNAKKADKLNDDSTTAVARFLLQNVCGLDETCVDRPYSTLSSSEQHRANVALTLAKVTESCTGMDHTSSTRTADDDTDALMPLASSSESTTASVAKRRKHYVIDEFSAVFDRTSARRFCVGIAFYLRWLHSKFGNASGSSSDNTKGDNVTNSSQKDKVVASPSSSVTGNSNPNLRKPAAITFVTVHEDVVQFLRPDFAIYSHQGSLISLKKKVPTEALSLPMARSDSSDGKISDNKTSNNAIANGKLMSCLEAGKSAFKFRGGLEVSSFLGSGASIRPHGLSAASSSASSSSSSSSSSNNPNTINGKTTKTTNSTKPQKTKTVNPFTARCRTKEDVVALMSHNPLKLSFTARKISRLDAAVSFTDAVRFAAITGGVGLPKTWGREKEVKSKEVKSKSDEKGGKSDAKAEKTSVEKKDEKQIEGDEKQIEKESVKQVEKKWQLDYENESQWKRDGGDSMLLWKFIWFRTFAEHHYLKGVVNGNTHHFLIREDLSNRPVAFVCSGIMPGGHNGGITFREVRIVVLPEWQGFGIGPRLSGAIAQCYLDRGKRYFAVTAHPSLGEYRQRHPDLWKPVLGNMELKSSGDSIAARFKQRQQGKGSLFRGQNSMPLSWDTENPNGIRKSQWYSMPLSWDTENPNGTKRSKMRRTYRHQFMGTQKHGNDPLLPEKPKNTNEGKNDGNNIAAKSANARNNASNSGSGNSSSSSANVNTNSRNKDANAIMGTSSSPNKYNPDLPAPAMTASYSFSLDEYEQSCRKEKNRDALRRMMKVMGIDNLPGGVKDVNVFEFYGTQ